MEQEILAKNMREFYLGEIFSTGVKRIEIYPPGFRENPPKKRLGASSKKGRVS